MKKTKISNNWLVVLIYASGLMTVSGLYNPFDDIRLPDFQAPRIRAPNMRMPRFRAPRINFRDEYNRLPSIPRYHNPRFYRPNVDFNVPTIREPRINLRDDYNRLPNLPRFNFRMPRFNFDSNNDSNNDATTDSTNAQDQNIDSNSAQNQNNDYQNYYMRNNINNGNTMWGRGPGYRQRQGFNDSNQIYYPNNNTNNNNSIYNNNNDNFDKPRINHLQREKCQPERLEHQVIMKRYNDSTGRWVIYSQIVETRNVGHHCHNNEFVYLAHRQKAGWLWNTTIKSLVHYSLGEPKFITRPVRDPLNFNNKILVNLSRNYAPATVDLDQAFPKRLAAELVTVGTDDLKWSELAKQFIPILKMDTAYLEMVKKTENSGVEQIKVLSENQSNMEVLE